jgi:hypothetical protein
MNPYESSAAPPEIPKDQNGRTHRGPALYIVCCGLPGLLIALPSLLDYNPFGLLAITVGCIAGGLFFRLIAMNGRHDPTVRWRQIVYSFVAVVLPILLCWLATDEYSPKIAYTVIWLSIGGSVAIGIFVSGTRRI